MMEFEQRVWQRCQEIPKGMVSTYKEIARSLDTKAYRAVGNSLRKNPYSYLNSSKVPCHRVIKSDGSLGGFHGSKDDPRKAELLRKEGLVIKDNRIKNFKKFLYTF